jgi:hypothetical protein
MSLIWRFEGDDGEYCCRNSLLSPKLSPGIANDVSGPDFFCSPRKDQAMFELRGLKIFVPRNLESQITGVIILWILSVFKYVKNGHLVTN